jgi:hypothetical protein
MGNTFSRHRRQNSDGSNTPGSHKLSKESNNQKHSRGEDTNIFVMDENGEIIDREPLDKSNPWGHMAAVVHGKHGG